MDDRRQDSTQNEVIEETLSRLRQADRELLSVIQTEIPLRGDLLEAYTFLQEAVSALTRTIPATGDHRPRPAGSALGARFL